MVSYISLHADKTEIDLEDLPYDMQYTASKCDLLSDSDSEIELTLRQLEMNYDLDIIKKILYIFEKNVTAIKKIGRNRMLKQLASQGLDLTESKIRTIINHLEANGLIIKGKTKQGTIISNRGKRLLNLIETREKIVT